MGRPLQTRPGGSTASRSGRDRPNTRPSPVERRPTVQPVAAAADALAPLRPWVFPRHPWKGDLMLVHATVEKMTAMHLTALAEAFQRQLASTQFAELSFEDRVAMLIDHEWTAREQPNPQRRLQSPNPRHQAALEDIDWQAPRRGLTRPSSAPSPPAPGSSSTRI